MHSRTRSNRIVMLFITAAVCFGLGFVAAIVTDLLAESSGNVSQGSEPSVPAVSTALSRQLFVTAALLPQRQTPLSLDLGHADDISRTDNDWVELTVIATAYNADKRSTGKEPGHPAYRVTYTGTTAVEGRTVAVDPNVIPLGSEIKIPALSPYTYIAEDTGRLIKGKRIDIYMEDEQDCLNWGVRYVRIMYRRSEKAWGCNRNYLSRISL